MASADPAILCAATMETKAVLAALVAFAVAAALTPLAAQFATKVGAVDEVKKRGLAKTPTPLLGGLAIFGGALVAGLLFLPDNQRTEGILAAAALITIVGAIDDVKELPPYAKLAGQIVEANTPDQFFSNPQHERTKLFLSQILH